MADQPDAAPANRRGRLKNARRVGAWGAGGFLGGIAVSQLEIIQDILRENGLAVTLTVLFVLASIALVWRLVDEVIDSKNDEIRRLVRHRDQLWDKFLEERPQSGAGPDV